MTPAKSQGSSHRKGKAVISTPPTTRDVGEEAMYSESDHSDEEKAQCDLDSECAPLIDPWYDIHPHFPKIPSDYAPLPLDYVWLALCWRNTDIPPRAYPFRVWIGYHLRLERLGGQRAFWHRFHGVVTMGRCFEGHHFIPLFI